MWDWHVNVNVNVIAWQERRTVIEAFGKLLHPGRLASCMMYVLCLGLLLRAALHLASLLLGHWKGLWRIRDGVLDRSGGEKSNATGCVHAARRA